MSDETKIPDHCEQAEWMLLACIIEKPDIFAAIELDHFYLNDCREVFARIKQFASQPDKINSVTVPMSFAHGNLPLHLKIVESLNALPSPSNWSYWLEICDDHRKARAVIREGAGTASHVEQCLSTGQSIETQVYADRLKAIASRSTEVKAAKDVMPQVLEEIEAAYTNPEACMGLLTPFPRWDRLLGGLQAGSMVVIAARPGVGKTAMAGNIVEKLAVKDSIPTLFFSLEMTAGQLYRRMNCSMAGVPFDNIKGQKLTETNIFNLSRAAGAIRKSPLYICDSKQDLRDIYATATDLIQSKGIRLVVIDYLQKIQVTGSRDQRFSQIATISSAIKGLAMEFKVPLVVLCQISREVEKEGRAPVLSDLRESGQIEQDADSVSFLNPTDPKDSATETLPVDLLLKKNRHGPNGLVKLRFNSPLMLFREEQPTDGDYRAPYKD